MSIKLQQISKCLSLNTKKNLGLLIIFFFLEDKSFVCLTSLEKKNMNCFFHVQFKGMNYT